MRRLPMLLLALASTLALGLVGCSEGGQGRVNVVHASPSAPNLNVRLAGATKLQDVGFKAFSRYVNVDAAEAVAVDLVAYLGGDTLLMGQMSVADNRNYSAFAYDDAAGNLQLLVLGDTLTRPTSGNCRLRVVHLAADAPAVDLLRIQGGDTSAINAYRNLSLGQHAGFALQPAGAIALGVAAAGTTNPLVSKAVTLEDGGLYTAFVAGLLNPANPIKGLDLVLIKHN